jgi:hypothetical protein
MKSQSRGRCYLVQSEYSLADMADMAALPATTAMSDLAALPASTRQAIDLRGELRNGERGRRGRHVRHPISTQISHEIKVRAGEGRGGEGGGISLSPSHRRRAMASAIGPAIEANSRGRGGQRESAGVVRAQAQPSHGPADCRCGGEGAARSSPLQTKIFAGDAGGLMRASSPPAQAIVARQGRDAKGGSVGAQRRLSAVPSATRPCPP